MNMVKIMKTEKEYIADVKYLEDMIAKKNFEINVLKKRIERMRVNESVVSYKTFTLLDAMGINRKDILRYYDKNTRI